MNTVLNNQPKKIKLELIIVSETEIAIRALNQNAAKWCSDFADMAFFSDVENVRVINKTLGKNNWDELCLSTLIDACYFPVNKATAQKIKEFFEGYWRLQWTRYYPLALEGKNFDSGLRIVKNL
jgi:hypothetical protein